MDTHGTGPLGRKSLTLATRALARPARFEAAQLVERRPRGILDEHGQALAAAMERARQEGLQQARGEVDAAVRGHHEARRELLAAAASLSGAVHALADRDQDDLQHLERQAIGFAVELAGELVGRELTTAGDALIASLARAMALAPDRGPVLLRVSPLDADRARSALLECAELTGRVEVLEDRSIERGGCAADVGPLRIDAQMGAALERARDAVRS